MTVPRHTGLRPPSTIVDQITLAALEYERPFTQRELALKTGRVVKTWLNAQVRQGNLTRLPRFNADDVDRYEWIN